MNFSDDAWILVFPMGILRKYFEKACFSNIYAVHRMNVDENSKSNTSASSICFTKFNINKKPIFIEVSIEKYRSELYVENTCLNLAPKWIHAQKKFNLPLLVVFTEFFNILRFFRLIFIISSFICSKFSFYLKLKPSQAIQVWQQEIQYVQNFSNLYDNLRTLHA